MLQRFAVALFLVPFLLLSLFSNGTMLARTADDRITVVICTGTEQVEMIWGEDGSLTPADKAPAQSHDDGQSCDWQISTHAALLTPLADVPSIAIDVVENRLSFNIPLHARRLNVLAASARGPPRKI